MTWPMFMTSDTYLVTPSLTVKPAIDTAMNSAARMLGESGKGHSVVAKPGMYQATAIAQTESFGPISGPAERQPPVTLMWRETAGRLVRRSMMKSWPFGLRPIASSMACDSSSLPSEARSGARRSAASSWPRHM